MCFASLRDARSRTAVLVLKGAYACSPASTHPSTREGGVEGLPRRRGDAQGQRLQQL
jgi:hypothetical protein